MALTKIPRGLLDTGIADSSDATAITIDSSENVTFAGSITANSGVVVDNITIDGTEIDLSSGDLTLDVAGEINLDADGGKIRFKDGGTEHLRFVLDNSGFVQLYSAVQDADIKIQGNDGGSVIDALVLDMSEAGAATFNSDVTTGGKLTINDGGNATVAAIRFNAGLGISSPSTDQMNFITADTSRMVISSAGMVTITPDSGATTGTLRLHNGNGNGTLGALEFGYSTNVDHGSIKYTGNMDFFTGDSTDSRFFISSSGNVGINTSSPEHHLHVTEPGSTQEDGIVKIGGSSTALGLELRYNQTGSTTTQIVANPTYTNTASIMKICVDGDANANQIVLTGAGTVSMGEFSTTDYRDGRLHTGLQGSGNDLRVTAGGNAHVDISAVTSNSAYFTINSGETRLNNDAGYIAFGHNTNHSVPAFVAYIMHRSRGATNQGYFDFYNRNSSGTAIHAARIDGDDSNGLYSRTGSVSNLSDQRLKKNIQDLTYSMDEFKAIKPRTFEWINTGDHPEGVQNGFVAQELPEHLKSTYDIGQKTGPLDEDIDPDYALVKDENGIGTAFAASLGSNDAMYVSIIQQLIARIEALEEK